LAKSGYHFNNNIFQVERDLADQEKKVIRAQRTCTALSKEMKDKVTNGDIFETDMNLRAEKEKQRAALIKLREISTIDPGSANYVSSLLC
jgi:hypothetical protein